MGPSNELYTVCQGATLRFTILGPLEVHGTDGAAVRLPAGRARTVLGLLCLSPGRVVSQDRLIDLAWNGAPPTSATTRLHGFVSELRRALPVGPEPVIRTVGRGYSLAVGEAGIDLHQARGLVAQARAHVERGDAAAAVRGLEDALALWRGPAFEGSECAYLQAEADAIEQEHADALEQLAELELALGRHAALVPGLGELVARYPLREGLRASLMRALAGSGRQAEAIDTYHELRRRLSDDLGVDPAPQVRELYASILDGDPRLLAPRPPQVSARPLPAQLPAGTSDFTGRRAQVRRLREALAPGADGPASAVVSVVSGPGGIGKSALAVHVTHLLTDAFPDGQLFVNLAGMSSSPLAPTDVLARLLRDLGVDADDVPADEAERAARYRSLLTGRRVLLVLDDARDAAQVRPLLPGAPGCAVLVTSRAALADLAGVHRVDLDEMAADEGRELFTRIVGASRAEAEPEATGRLLQSCAGLPLAIRIIGAKLASRPGWSIDAMAARLTAQRLRLAELRVGDLAVRASFQLSYHTLGEDSARMFRLLGLAELPLFGASQAGALCGVDGERAERLLDALADAHMLQSPAPGVYRFHDLLRLFAIELAGTELSPDEGDQAVGRLLLWYAHALRAAGLELSRGRSAPPEAEPMTAWTGAQLPEFASHRAAMEWCEREYPALMWAVQEAARRRRPGLAANMACWMWAYATRASTPADYVTCPRIGLECARELGAEHAQRWLLNCLGSALGRIAEHESAIDCYLQAIEVGRRTGDDAGGAASLNNIANIRHEQGRYADAVAYYLAAAEAAEAAGRPDHVGVILVNAANSNRDMGAYAEALDVYSRALEILLAADSAYQVAAARSGLGDTLRLLGRLEESLAQHELAVAIQRDLGTRDRQFLDALDWLGQAYAACGRHDEARCCWAEALRLADETGSPLAAALRRRTQDVRSVTSES